MAKKQAETSDAAKAPRNTLTKEQRVAIFKASGGQCWVFGTQLDPLGAWHVDEGVLLSPEAKKLKGGRSLEELRTHMAEQVSEAHDKLMHARDELKAAEENLRDMNLRVRDLLTDSGAIRFAGESKVAETTAP